MNFNDLAIIFAALLSDGSITHKKSIFFNNKDMILINIFKDSFKSFFQIPEDMFKGNWCKPEFKEKVKRIYICSKDIALFLLNFSKFRHNPFYEDGRKIYPVVHIPDMILEGKSEIKNSFLRMYASCDGSVDISIRYPTRGNKYQVVGCVTLACENPTLNLDLYSLFVSLGYSPVRENRRIRLTKLKDMIKFHEECGFVNGSKILKTGHGVHFYDEEKNKVLELLIYVLKAGIPEELSKVQKSDINKAEIRTYLALLLDKIKNNEKLPIIKHKVGKTSLNQEERNWIMEQKIVRDNARINKKYKNPAIEVVRIFKKKFNKDIDDSTIYWYWTRYKHE